MRFKSKGELGRFLFDSTVQAHHTGSKRLRIAVASAVAAEHLWAKCSNGGGE